MIRPIVMCRSDESLCTNQAIYKAVGTFYVPVGSKIYYSSFTGKEIATSQPPFFNTQDSFLTSEVSPL